MTIRVSAFIDGFNLYHALDGLGSNHLKWLDLRKLIGCFVDPNVHDISAIYYFSAYATWLPGPYARHQEYVAALKASGVVPILGNFKQKRAFCKQCGSTWATHEEKESDVNIAVKMIESAIDNEFDQAFLVTQDSDMSRPVRIVGERFKKPVKVLAPPGRPHSKELGSLAAKRASIKRVHVEASLFPETVLKSDGSVAARRPSEYDPPV